MKVSLFKKYYTHSGQYQGIEIIMFETELFKFKWFTDCGEWFLYIHWFQKWIRFGSAGFIKSK
jgi:hypothetical protein